MADGQTAIIQGKTGDGEMFSVWNKRESIFFSLKAKDCLRGWEQETGVGRTDGPELYGRTL